MSNCAYRVGDMTRAQPLMLCPDCDLLIRAESFDADPGFRQQAVCPRCRHILEEHRPGGMVRCLALVCTGLLLFIPANFLPVLFMEILGNQQHTSVWGGVVGLWQEGMIPVALLVGFSAMLVPLVRLLILLQVLLAAYWGVGKNLALGLFRRYIHLSEWGMMEIYFLGVLVAVIKLADMASVHPGIGLFCFAGLMLAELGISLNLNEHALWNRLCDRSLNTTGEHS